MLDEGLELHHFYKWGSVKNVSDYGSWQAAEECTLLPEEGYASW